MANNLSIIREELIKCTRCGSCQSACPVHQVDVAESTCARGKIFLAKKILENDLNPSKAIAKIFSKCLLCKRCVSGCSAKVDIYKVLMAARRDLAEKAGIPLAKRMAFTSLTYRKLFSLGMQITSKTQGLFFKKNEHTQGMTPRIPWPSAGLPRKRRLPAVAQNNLYSQLSSVLSTPKTPRGRVLFYPGCMFQFFYPQTAIAIINALQKNDIEVIVPQELFCCGMAAAIAGEASVATLLATKNIETFSKTNFDAIVTGCASCGDALQTYAELPLSEETHKKYEQIKNNIFDITTYLSSIGLRAKASSLPMKVTVHDPCHLVRGMQVRDTPRQIIQQIPGVQLIEMRGADDCCGCGGTFSIDYYDISTAINDKKITSIHETEADVVATGCPACRMHIEDGIARNNLHVRVMHPIELLVESYK